MLSTTTQPHNSSVLARTAFWLFVLVLYILIFLFDLLKRVRHGVKRASVSKEHPELTNTALPTCREMPKESKKDTKVSKRADDGKKRRAKKDPNAPKRGLSAYMFFSQAHRKVVQEENPEAGFGKRLPAVTRFSLIAY